MQRRTEQGIKLGLVKSETIRMMLTMGKISLLFEDIARKHFTENRIQKYRGWVENATESQK